MQESKHKHKWPLQLCLKINASCGGGEQGGKLWCFINASNKIFWIIHVFHYLHIFSSLVQTISIPLQYQIETYTLGWNIKLYSYIQNAPKTPNGFWNLTVVMFGNVLNLVDGVLVSETHCGTGIVYQKKVLQLNGVVTDSIFKDVMLLVAVVCYCGYRNGIKKDRWKTVNHRFISYIWQSGAGKRCHNAKSTFHRDCRIVLNNIVVTYKVSHLNSNESDEFTWIWNVSASVNISFPLSCFKILFHFENHQMFLVHQYKC